MSTLRITYRMGMRDGLGDFSDKVALQRRVKHGLIP